MFWISNTEPPIDRQIRQGIANATKGTAFVVYEDVMDAKQACDKLNGFNFQNRYLVGMLLLAPRVRLDVKPADGDARQYYITSPRRRQSQKKTSPNGRRT